MKALQTVIAGVLVAMSAGAYAQAPTSANEDCTTDVVERKAQELADRVSEISKSDPDRAAKLNEEIRQMNVKRTQRRLGNECEAYDQRIRDLEQAEQQSGMPKSEQR
ncbi:hypothetical protein [Stutzerimonas azotifigens]|uniref:hypothetical protein n=1 Tax=Stutzerimonas azotifigens TaxID=291995 RepID=UPI00040728B2|nr:hypothetical protein [Stutzerimonas azotifigens]